MIQRDNRHERSTGLYTIPNLRLPFRHIARHRGPDLLTRIFQVGVYQFMLGQVDSRMRHDRRSTYLRIERIKLGLGFSHFGFQRKNPIRRILNNLLGDRTARRGGPVAVHVMPGEIQARGPRCQLLSQLLPGHEQGRDAANFLAQAPSSTTQRGIG